MYIPALIWAHKGPMTAFGALVPNHAVQAVALERACTTVVHGLALAVLLGVHKDAVGGLAWTSEQRCTCRHSDGAH